MNNEQSESDDKAYPVDTLVMLPCPFCGEEPELETEGTWIEISCCASMGRQKSDYLSIEERESWNNDIHRFGIYEEFKALCAVASEWNSRQHNQEVNSE